MMHVMYTCMCLHFVVKGKALSGRHPYTMHYVSEILGAAAGVQNDQACVPSVATVCNAHQT